MPKDYSTYSAPLGALFDLPQSAAEWTQARLTDEQVGFFHEQGYLAGVRILSETQVERLRAELVEVMNPSHPSHSLFYEFHSNEAIDA